MAPYTTSSSSSSTSNKRQKLNHDDDAIITRRKQHLYLALDDWEGGYSIHKMDADEIMDDSDDDHESTDDSPRERELLLHKLPEPAAVRLASPVASCLMAFAAMGTHIFVATNPRCRFDEHAPKMFVYDAATGALSAGPRVPADRNQLYDFGASMAVGETLYALTSVGLELNEIPTFHALSWAPNTRYPLGPWEPRMEWSWSCAPPPDPPFNGFDIAAYALHPDGRTIFVSTTSHHTHAFDTGDGGVWTDLGYWVLPFRGQAYFDAELDAWVGLHRKQDGYVCCCPVASRSRSAAATAMEMERPPVLCSKLLKEKLFGKEEYPKRQRLDTTLTYMGDSRFCLIENVMPRAKHLGAVLHVTLFGLKYDHRGELQTKIRRKTRSYAVSKNTFLFSHAAFWL